MTWPRCFDGSDRIARRTRRAMPATMAWICRRRPSDGWKRCAPPSRSRLQPTDRTTLGLEVVDETRRRRATRATCDAGRASEWPLRLRESSMKGGCGWALLQTDFSGTWGCSIPDCSA